MLTKLRRFLNRLVEGLREIPPDARVDPDPFPEDEFPVVCPKCGYSLRGLPDGRCPECGRAFERGRLLVEEYVLEHGDRLHKWSWRHTWWLMLLPQIPILGMSALLSVTAWLVKRGVWPPNAIMRANEWIPVFFLLGVLCFVPWLVGAVLGLRGYWSIRKKRQAIKAAIELDPERTKRVKRRKEDIAIVGIVVLVVFTFVVIYMEM